MKKILFLALVTISLSASAQAAVGYLFAVNYNATTFDTTFDFGGDALTSSFPADQVVLKDYIASNLPGWGFNQVFSRAVAFGASPIRFILVGNDFRLLEQDFGLPLAPTAGNYLLNSSLALTAGSLVIDESSPRLVIPGAYSVEVLNNPGVSIGQYVVTVSSVPEPSSYALIFSSVALVGTVCSRRRRLRSA